MARKAKVDFTKMERVPNTVDYVDDSFHFYLSYKGRVLLYVISTVLLLIGAYFLVTRSYNDLGIRKLGYNENGNASDYLVKVRPDEFYPNGEVESGMNYVLNNVDSIDANFKYNIYFSDMADVRYEYNVNAILLIYGENDKLLAPKQVIPIIDKNYVNLKSSNKFNLSVPVRINYKEYRSKIEKYFADNGVTGTAKLLVTMDVLSTIRYDYFEDAITKSSVVQMEIPLTSDNNQIQIKTSNYNNDDHFERVIIGEPTNENLLYLGLVLFILAIVTFIYFIAFLVKTNPKKGKYNSLRDGLLKEFDQRIVEVKRIPSLAGLNVIDCYSFSELLDAQDTLKKPILYSEIVKNQKCEFVIVDDKNAFRYVLKAVDLEFK